MSKRRGTDSIVSDLGGNQCRVFGALTKANGTVSTLTLDLRARSTRGFEATLLAGGGRPPRRSNQGVPMQTTLDIQKAKVSN